jgi:hypothetical protein
MRHQAASSSPASRVNIAHPATSNRASNANFQPRDERDRRPPRDGGRFQRNGQDRRFLRNDTMPMEAEQPGLPSFITAPVRNTIGSEAPVAPSFVETAVPVDPNFVEPSRRSSPWPSAKGVCSRYSE